MARLIVAALAVALAWSAAPAAAKWGPSIPLDRGVVLAIDDSGRMLVAEPRDRSIAVRRVDAAGRRAGPTTVLTLPRGAEVAGELFAQAKGGGVGGAASGRGGSLAVPLCLRVRSTDGGPRGCARSRVAVGSWPRAGATRPLRFIGEPNVDAGFALEVAGGVDGEVSLMWEQLISERRSQTIVVRPGPRGPVFDTHRYASPAQEMPPAIAMTPTGTTVATWTQADGIAASWDGRTRLIGRYRNGGNFLGTAAGADGTVAGTWVDGRGRLWMATAREGTRPRQRVVARRTNDYGVPAALAVRHGRVAIAWVDRADGVRVRSGPVTGALGRERRLGRIDAYGWPKVAIDAHGRTVVAAAAFSHAWAQRTGDRRRTIARAEDCELWRPIAVSPSAHRLAVTLECRRTRARVLTLP